jgi:predicted amidophosphoribosyltransferase
MRPRVKRKVEMSVVGTLLLVGAAFTWLIDPYQSAQFSYFFFFSHYVNILIAIGLLILSLLPTKVTLRFCPTCQLQTEQYTSKARWSEKTNEWTCDTCGKKNTSPFETKKEPQVAEPAPHVVTTQPAQTQAQPILSTKFCRECGVSIPRDSTFCEECGKKLA